MPALLVYSFLQDAPPFPDQLLNPTTYRMETFSTREAALRKARYVSSHSRVYNLAIWDIEPALADSEVRRWIDNNPAADLSPASEAQAPAPRTEPSSSAPEPGM
jgi:hypothetical protein